MSALKIYLAGKISHGCGNDWRTSILTEKTPAHRISDPGVQWATEQGVILGKHHFNGPFVYGDNHGTYGNADHGDWADDTAELWKRRMHIRDQCLRMIADSDLVFAWIDDVAAFGTLVEIGYACGLWAERTGNTPLVAVWSPRDFSRDEHWFAQSMADSSGWADTPIEALECAIARLFPEPKPDLCGSPAERAMLNGLQAVGVRGFEQQYPFDRYKLDFAWPDKKLAVEVDGFAYHDAKPEQAEHDKRRDRNLQLKGWRTIRFAAREVFRDPNSCARQVAQMLGGLR